MTPREYLAVRVGDDLSRVRQLAEQETEGNVSAMVRKLIRESLAARDRKAKRCARADQIGAACRDQRLSSQTSDAERGGKP